MSDDGAKVQRPAPIGRQEETTRRGRTSREVGSKRARRTLATSIVLALAGLALTCLALASEQPARRLAPDARPRANFHLSSAPEAAAAAAAAHENAEANAGTRRHANAPSRLDEVARSDAQETASRARAQGAGSGPLAPVAGVARPSPGRHKRATQARASGAQKPQNAGRQRANELQARDDAQPATAATGGRAAGAHVKNVTAQNGQSVTLHCLVEPAESGELASVSWFRGTGELQLISFESSAIIQDERFVVRRGLARENDWALQISNLNKTTDAGLYQCQTSGESSPELQSYQLNIVEPQASILGPPDLPVRVGAPLNLTCLISQSPDQLQFVFWYRDERMINYDLERERSGKIVLSKPGQRPDTIASNLQLFRTRPADSGNYTCAPSGAKSASAYVHVLEASDKRLIMFQSDDNQQRELFAASSAQGPRNSAAPSSQLARLEGGRAYALLVGLFILASWLQLVVQLQTFVSLALLAVIGLFLGRATAGGGGGGGGQARKPTDDHHHHRRQDDEGHLGSPYASARKLKRPTSGSGRRVGGRPDCARGRRLAGEGRGQGGDSLEEDPLLSGANSALHLLRRLTRSSDSTCSASESIELAEGRERHATSSPAPSPSATAAAARTPCYAIPPASGRALPLSSQTAQTSPSGSSSTSTGYNSDTRQAAASVRLLASSPDDGKRSPVAALHEELEMIELLRNRPSAMRLIMEQLRAGAEINQLDGGASCAHLSKQAPWSSAEATLSGGGGGGGGPSSSLGRRPFVVAAAGKPDQGEPIYSIPAPSPSAAPPGDGQPNHDSSQSNSDPERRAPSV